MKTVLLILLILNVSLLFSQNWDAEIIESKLITEFVNYYSSDYDSRYDVLLPQLRTKVENLLSNSISFECSFDSLAKYLKIIKSEDEKLRIFSWNNLTGGTFHQYDVFIQYKTNNDKIKTQWLDSIVDNQPEGLTEAIQFEIYDIGINGNPYYLCFGRGTRGAGHHHNTILIFSIERDSIKFLPDLIDKKYQFLQAPRGYDLNLKYDKKAEVISFNEFIHNDELNYFIPTDKIVKLKLENGKFTKSGG